MNDGSRGTFERTLKVKRLAALTVPENLKEKSRYWSIFLPNITWKKRFVCCQCPESFVSRHLKNVHERSHTGEKGFICDQCGESFATSQGLSHHKSKHTGDYQFRCRACDKGFNNYKLLEEHFHIHTGNKPYQCNKCDKGFFNRGSSWIHMK